MREFSGQDGAKGTRFTLSHETTITKKPDKIYGKPLYFRNEGGVISEKWDSFRDECHNCSVYCPNKVFRLKHKKAEGLSPADSLS